MNSRTTGPGSASLEELQTYWRMPSVRATRELAKQLRVRRVNRSCRGLEDSLGLSRGRQSRANPLGREPKATLPSPSAALATSPMICQHSTPRDRAMGPARHWTTEWTRHLVGQSST